MSGPFQTISTPSSRDAFTAPACTLFQNSWVVPFGMTAIRMGLAPPSAVAPALGVSDLQPAAASATSPDSTSALPTPLHIGARLPSSDANG